MSNEIIVADAAKTALMFAMTDSLRVPGAKAVYRSAVVMQAEPV